MSFNQFVQSLQTAKKELQRPERMTFAEIAAACEKMSELILRSNFLSLDTSASLFSSHFYSKEVQDSASRAFKKASQELKSQETIQAFPIGVIGVYVNSAFYLRLICERLAPALAAGNVVMTSALPNQIPIANEIKKRLQESGFSPDSFQILPHSEEISSLLAQHPGIRGVNIFDPALNSQTLGGPTWSEKKYQIHRGGKVTALVLADADLDKAVHGIIEAIVEGQGSLSWNISRIIMIETIEQAFKEKLKAALLKLSPQLSPVIEERKRVLIKKFQDQQARLISPESSFGFLENVSNCSEEHQVELGAPVIFTMAVKYPADMQKWINNLPNSLGVQIWGSEEKAQRLACKLETGRVWLGSWINQDDDLFFGVKSSVFGHFNSQVFGGAYSETRKIDGSLSK